MRAVPADWDAANKSRIKRPRYIMRLSFSDTDQYYFTSHADCPLPAGALSYPSTISNRPRGISQKLYKSEGRSDVGKLVVSLIDKNGAVSDLIQQKRASGIGMNGRKVEMLIGFADQPFDSYVVVATQIIRRTQLKGGRYTITCNDIQRALRKDIFTAAETVLTQTLEEGDTTIYVGDTSGFQLVAHGSSYSDAPNQTVGYVRIEDEIIRYTGTTANTLTGVTRGVLNTAPARHVVDASGNTSPPPVTEYIYLEMPAVKLALALMTGDLYGQSGARLPDGWHLGIDPVYVRESDYTAIGADWWDPANDQAGVVVRFEGLKKQDGKSFIGQQLMLLLGAFQPVYSDGTLGLKRATRTLSSAAHLGVIGVSDLAQSLAEITIDDALDEVVNIVTINWNYDPVLDRTTRTTVLVDDANGAAHGYGEQKDLTFLGLHGSRHSMEVLQARFDAIHDAFSAPPKRLRLTLKHRWNTLEVGDVVRVQLPLRDNAEAGDIDRAFEVQSVQVDWYSGNVVVDLFGSTGTPGRSALSVSTVLPDNIYTSQGVELSSALPAGAIEIIGGVAHLTTTNMPTGGYQLAGGADISAPEAIYYHVSDLVIDDDVVVNITSNLQLRVAGHITINGVINGAGRGKPGSLPISSGEGGAPGVIGYIGATKPMGGFKDGSRPGLITSTEGHLVVGINNTMPVDYVVWDGENLLSFAGDRTGTSGGSGKNLVGYGYAGESDIVGGAGGASGAAIAIICRGISFGVSGVIDVSGADGELGENRADVLGTSGPLQQAGSGAGGYHGSVSIALDGSAANYPSNILRNIIANVGVTPLPDGGTRAAIPVDFNFGKIVPSPPQPWYGYYTGLNNSVQDGAASAYSITYVTDASTSVEDPSVQVVQPPTALSLASGDAYVRIGADGSRTARINVNFTASVNEYLSGHEIQYKRSADPDSAYESVSGILPVGVTVATFSPPEDGVEYTVRVRARNRFGYVSDWVSGVIVADGKSTPPAAPGGLVGTGVPNGIQWAWNNSADNDIRYTEIHIATTNNRAQASLQGRISAENWLQDGLTPGVTQYCWIRHIDTSGNAGAWYPTSATAGVVASAGAQDYNSVANTPTQLADINATEGNKLTGVEPGANVTETRTAADTAAVSGVSSDIVRSGVGVSFRSGFEDAEFVEWQNKTYSTVAQDNNAFSGSACGLFTWTGSAGAEDSTGSTTGSSIAIPEEIALQFGGKRIRVTIYAKQPTTNAADEFAVAYSTSEVGNSGWQKFSPGTSWAPYTFIYDVPAPAAGGADYLGVWADTSHNGLSVLIDNVVIEIVQAESELDALQLTNGPAAPGADVTQAALEALVQLTSGGLHLTGGDAKIMLGLVTAFMAGAGIYMDDNNGSPLFRVGDPDNEKFISYDQGGDFDVGRDTELRGADAYNNMSIYIHEIAHSYGSFYKETIGNSSVKPVDGIININLDRSAVGNAAIYRYGGLGALGGYTWDKKRRLKVMVHLGSVMYPGVTVDICTGYRDFTGAGVDIRVGFQVVDGVVYGLVKNASGIISYPLGSVTSSSWHVFEIVHDPGVSDQFYIDGQLRLTINNTTPTGSGFNSYYPLSVSVENTSVDSLNTYMYIGEFKFLQEK